MEKKCLSCDWARYTVHDGKVGCAYWSAAYHDQLGNEGKSDDLKSYDMYKSGLRTVWDGWVYLKRRPEKEQSDVLGEGIMTNFCTIVDEDALCKQFKDR